MQMNWKSILWAALTGAALGAATALNDERKNFQKGVRTPISGLPKRQPVSRRRF